jgi:nicotinate-nucleotide pyrophosphorylase (carboxylating)
VSLFLPEALLLPLVTRALDEDLGHGGDVTAFATLPAGLRSEAALNARAAGIAAGTELAALVFRTVDPAAETEVLVQDGAAFEAGQPLLKVAGPARSLVTAERTALNLLSHLCGIATVTRRYVDAVAETRASIAATRKTLPGLRLVQKHAVRCGGGMTHRMSLSDAVMIKDNHIAAAGSIADAIEKARHYAGHTVKIEVEVDRIDQLREALAARPDIVLLDNMSTDELSEAVRFTDGRALLEASGGVDLATVGPIARTGVDVISVGALTHSVTALDVGMELSA